MGKGILRGAAFWMFLGTTAAGTCSWSVAADNASIQARRAAAKPKSRSFEFTYGALLKQLPLDSLIRVWLPVPLTNELQNVRQVDASLPSEATFADDPTYGNRILYFTTYAPASGEIDFSMTYGVQRREVLGMSSQSGSGLSEAQRQLFLSASAKVPIEGRPLELLNGLDLPRNDALRLGQLLYNKVDDHMKYDKSKPGYGFGDAVWACDSRFGNCTDFHSLFISMARSQGVPARFEIGFPLPEERGEGPISGYHCWAFFHVDNRGWIPVDISEADKFPDLKKYYFGNLSEDRVMFSVGRDLTLVPRQSAAPLNYFVYPHVEVDGQVWPAEKLEMRFGFKDI